MAVGQGTEVERLIVRLIGDSTSYEKMLRRAQGLTKATAAKMKAIGTRMSLAVTAPIVGLGALATREFASFDKAMTESTSIMKVTEEQIKSMRETALSLSGQAVQGPTELARAYFFLASAGKNAEQSMALLPQLTQFATAGAFDLATATDLLTDAQSALGLSSKDVARDTENLTRVSDVLVKANTLSRTYQAPFFT